MEVTLDWMVQYPQGYMTQVNKSNLRFKISQLGRSGTIMTFGNLLAKSSALLLLLPLITKTFDDNDILVWYVYSTIYSLQLILDFGFTPTIARHVSYSETKNNLGKSQQKDLYLFQFVKSNEAYSKQVQISAHYIYKCLTVLVFVIASTLGTYLVANSLNQATEAEQAWVGWWAVLGVGSFTLYANLYTSMLTGKGLVAVVQKQQMKFAVLAIVSSSISLLLFESLMVTVLTFYFWSFISFMFFRKKYKKNFGKIESISESEKIAEFKKGLVNEALRSGVGILFSLGLLQISGLVASRLASASDAASYMITLQLVRAFSSFSQAPFYSQLPRWGKLFLDNNKRKLLINDVSYRVLLSLTVYSALSLLTLIFLQAFFELLNITAPLPDKSLFAIAIIAVALERVCSMMLQFYTLAGKVVWHKVNGINGILIVIFCYVSYEFLGIWCFFYASILAYLVFFIPYMNKLIQNVFNGFSLKYILLFLCCFSFVTLGFSYD